MTDELRPCPFCGATPTTTDYIRDGRRVNCECGAAGAPAYHGPASEPSADARAIAAWNRRASDPAPAWRPTHRHVKRGTDYEVIGGATLQCATVPALDDVSVLIYRDKDGRPWVRLEGEFNDGRFEPLPTPPGGEPAALQSKDTRP